MQACYSDSLVLQTKSSYGGLEGESDQGNL